MDWLLANILWVTIFFPLFWGGVFVGLAFLFLPAKSPEPAEQGKEKAPLSGWFPRWFFLAGSLLEVGLLGLIAWGYDYKLASFQFQAETLWIAPLGLHLALGIDFLSLSLMALSVFLLPLMILSSWNSISNRQTEYYFWLFALISTILGALASIDLFLFYIFWESMLIPLFFLVGVFGGPARVYAAMKFFLFTLAGSLLMLAAIAFLAHAHGVQFGLASTLLTDLVRLRIPFAGFASPQGLLFAAFALAFCIKIPLFPLHTWLPDAHVQAPTAGSVILAAVLLKMGTFGLVRFAMPLFPQAASQFSEVFMAIAAVAIVYGACLAIVQTDIKKCVAYSSVSHMGFIVLGLFSENVIGVTGALFQMVSHGLSTAGLFLLVGVIYERRHTREIEQFGGIAQRMPFFAIAFIMISLGAMALPSTTGFVGEFLILLGSFSKSPWMTAVAALGVILGAVYMLWMIQRLFFGEVTRTENQTLTDINGRELLMLGPLVILIFALGVNPGWLLAGFEQVVKDSSLVLKH
jgi:NADH-quinone oxidoreductase subunit M